MFIYTRGVNFLKKGSEFKRKLITCTLDLPEYISKEFDFPTFDTKVLDDLKVLEIKAFEIPTMAAIVCQIKVCRKF